MEIQKRNSSKMSSIIRMLARLDDKDNYRIIEKNYDDPANLNEELCARCKGHCCKRCGCHFSPYDFEEISYEYLMNEIKKGYISIDYVDREVLKEDRGVYIMRIRNKNAKIVDFGDKRTRCILLGENGCMLSYEKRPSGGRLLIPRTYFEAEVDQEVLGCYSKYSIEDCCQEWKRYQEVLVKLLRYFRDKDYPCSLEES